MNNLIAGLGTGPGEPIIDRAGGARSSSDLRRRDRGNRKANVDAAEIVWAFVRKPDMAGAQHRWIDAQGVRSSTLSSSCTGAKR